ncbi:primosomal protein N' [Salinisphaera sp. PC39]|uniref:primosomal protein N' n=1 Tax=Salinisphaera sp. PC39 TaxID=1304156 RepID=UPI00333E84DC
MSRAIRVAVPAPLHGGFDYLPPAAGPAPVPGARVRVPFGRRRLVGVVTATSTEPAVAGGRLRRIEAVLDSEPVLPPGLRELCTWAARYYHHPLGEVYAATLPVLLRQGRPAERRPPRLWRLTETGRALDGADLARAPRQQEIWRVLADAPAGLTTAALRERCPAPADTLRRMAAHGWIESVAAAPAAPAAGAPTPALGPEQAAAVGAVGSDFAVHLLHGVTGSGKTEVYLALVERALAAGRQALILVPEIGLTPQLIERFSNRLATPIAVLHSGLGDAERLDAWLAAREGSAGVVLGTRSAVFTPLARPGLIVVDEEHDPSYKQQDGLRYSARDLAVRRAQIEDVPAVLGSATPALETLHNARRGRYRHLRLTRRATGADIPAVRLLDVRSRKLSEGLSEPLLQRIAHHLEGGGQALLFLNRRGYAPALICHDCGWIAHCRRCDAALTLHRGGRRLDCHHCGAQRSPPAVCEHCGGKELIAVGEGTERVAAALRARFPDVRLARFDRDAVAAKGRLEDLLAEVRSGAARLLVGTQMLAKGHDFPDLSLVGVVNADHGLFSADFRAFERMAQLVTQVAGRAGRGDRAGEVVLQTRHPDHPLLRRLLESGYDAFAEAMLAEREAVGLPPFGHLALLQAEAPGAEAPARFLDAAADLAGDAAGVELWGPAPAPMERRAGRYRFHLLLRAGRRGDLHRFLDAWLPRLAELPGARRVRWAIDVDPQDLI